MRLPESPRHPQTHLSSEVLLRAWSCHGSLSRVGLRGQTVPELDRLTKHTLAIQQNRLNALELGAANVLPALQGLLGCSPEKNTSKDRRLGLLLSNRAGAQGDCVFLGSKIGHVDTLFGGGGGGLGVVVAACPGLV